MSASWKWQTFQNPKLVFTQCAHWCCRNECIFFTLKHCKSFKIDPQKKIRARIFIFLQTYVPVEFFLLLQESSPSLQWAEAFFTAMVTDVWADVFRKSMAITVWVLVSKNDVDIWNTFGHINGMVIRSCHFMQLRKKLEQTMASFTHWSCKHSQM